MMKSTLSLRNWEKIFQTFHLRKCPIAQASWFWTDNFQFAVLAHNIDWQVYWLFFDDQRVKFIEKQVTEAGASGSNSVSSAAPKQGFQFLLESFNFSLYYKGKSAQKCDSLFKQI